MRLIHLKTLVWTNPDPAGVCKCCWKHRQRCSDSLRWILSFMSTSFLSCFILFFPRKIYNFRKFRQLPVKALRTRPINPPLPPAPTISSFSLQIALMNQTCFYFFVLFFLTFATTQLPDCDAEQHKRHRSGGGEGVWSWLSNCKRAGLRLRL